MISDNSVVAISSIAEQLLMDDLRKFSDSHLQSVLGVNTAIKFLLDGIEAQDDGIIKKCMDIIVANFQALHGNDELKRVPFTVMFQILKRDDLQVWDECDFYLFLDSYYKQHTLTKEQLQSLYELGKTRVCKCGPLDILQVRFPYLSISQLKEIERNENIPRQLIIEGYRERLSLIEKPSIFSYRR